MDSRAGGDMSNSDGLRRILRATRQGQMIKDLAMLVKMLVRRIRKLDPKDTVAAKAMDYLKRNGLQGSPLRGKDDEDG